ncbi:MAG TPA: universal stress protein, partial [Roseiflexaceae bacterium]|nr:universal stress protein [Roseiflexaceae bacterium]
MKTILVPLDGSTLAEQVLPWVRALAPVLDANVQLLHVVSENDRYHLMADNQGIDETGGVPVAPMRYANSWEPLRRNAQNYLEYQASLLASAGIAVEIDVRLGQPDEIIVEAAENAKVAMIAMATHGYSGLKRWTLGSVTDKVIHATSTPVFVIRGGDTPVEPLAFQRILVPLDGSELARRALPLAAELATRTGAEMLLLSVATPPIMVAPEMITSVPLYDVTLEARQTQLRLELDKLADRLTREQLRVTRLVSPGTAAETIVDTAKERNVDLIVMATHGLSGIRRWALGSVADKVLHATTTPLLLVRASYALSAQG